MMTLSGTSVTRTEGVPTLSDIATGLGRIWRFGGQTRQRWTVAHHSVVCQRLADFYTGRWGAQVLALFHDAHECLTGDIPTTFKTPDMSELQARLDERIFNRYRILPSGDDLKIVKHIDAIALQVEAYMVCPRSTYQRIRAENAGTLPLSWEIEIVQDVLEEGGENPGDYWLDTAIALGIR